MNVIVQFWWATPDFSDTRSHPRGFEQWSTVQACTKTEFWLRGSMLRHWKGSAQLCPSGNGGRGAMRWSFLLESCPGRSRMMRSFEAFDLVKAVEEDFEELLNVCPSLRSDSPEFGHLRPTEPHWQGVLRGRFAVCRCFSWWDDRKPFFPRHFHLKHHISLERRQTFQAALDKHDSQATIQVEKRRTREKEVKEVKEVRRCDERLQRLSCSTGAVGKHSTCFLKKHTVPFLTWRTVCAEWQLLHVLGRRSF